METLKGPKCSVTSVVIQHDWLSDLLVAWKGIFLVGSFRQMPELIIRDAWSDESAVDNS